MKPKERRKKEREVEREDGGKTKGGKKLLFVYCVLALDQEFPLAGTSFNHLNNIGMIYYCFLFYIINSSFMQ